MGYDAMANDASSPAVAREAKKKRVRGSSIWIEVFPIGWVGVLIRLSGGHILQGNRSAKLKQSKLDVRREQWLWQGPISHPIPNYLFLSCRFQQLLVYSDGLA
jgi:hypothetical protein